MLAARAISFLSVSWRVCSPCCACSQWYACRPKPSDHSFLKPFGHFCPRPFTKWRVRLGYVVLVTRYTVAIPLAVWLDARASLFFLHHCFASSDFFACHCRAFKYNLLTTPASLAAVFAVVCIAACASATSGARMALSFAALLLTGQ